VRISYPLRCTAKVRVGYSSGQRGQTVNLLAYAYEGSNPSPTTTYPPHKTAVSATKTLRTTLAAPRKPYRSPSGEVRFMDTAFKSFEFLARVPEAGIKAQLRNERLKEVRFWVMPPPFNKWLIFYRLESGAVCILRVLYGAQDWREEPESFSDADPGRRAVKVDVASARAARATLI